jgi:hypothetical protein
MRKLMFAPFGALRRYVSRELWMTFLALERTHGWRRNEATRLPSRGDALPDVLRRRFGGVPEVVLFWESYPDMVRHREALAAAGSRVYVMTDDLHPRHDRMREALRLADGVLTPYAPQFPAFFPDVDPSRVAWVPHSAGPDFLLPLHAAPRPVVLVSGAMGRVYPFRRAMRNLALRCPELADLQDHPGYSCSFDYSGDMRVGRGFAESMRACLAAFTDASTYGYLLAKHFEIPATGALLLADRAVAPQLALLGFADGVHYLTADASDLEPVVAHIIDPATRPEIDAIRHRGHALVHARHTAAHRAARINEVCV